LDYGKRVEAFHSGRKLTLEVRNGNPSMPSEDDEMRHLLAINLPLGLHDKNEMGQNDSVASEERRRQKVSLSFGVSGLVSRQFIRLFTARILLYCSIFVVWRRAEKHARGGRENKERARLREKGKQEGLCVAKREIFGEKQALEYSAEKDRGQGWLKWKLN